MRMRAKKTRYATISMFPSLQLLCQLQQLQYSNVVTRTSLISFPCPQANEGEPEEADDDNMEEIDTDNIVDSRTRGKEIDYAQAAKDLEDDDEDDEDDEDFQDDDMMED
jgi:hypothetical protein